MVLEIQLVNGRKLGQPRAPRYFWLLRFADGWQGWFGPDEVVA